MNLFSNVRTTKVTMPLCLRLLDIRPDSGPLKLIKALEIEPG